jgi:hypothetical protein
MDTETTRFPLTWPKGWGRTPARERQRAPFAKTMKVGTGGITPTHRDLPLTPLDAVTRLSTQLGYLHATHELLSTNLQVRLDGLVRGGQPEPSDPGAAVYFRLKNEPRALACDKWLRVADNIAALAAHIDAIRRIDRYGVGTLEQVFTAYAALPASAGEWWLVLGVPRTATPEQIKAAYRHLAQTHHPDRGGNLGTFQRINDAKDQALRGGSAHD